MDICYNDCKLNRVPTKKAKTHTRCIVCQLQVHNVCLDEPKKDIGTGAWTCRICRKVPTNITILHDLIIELSSKIDTMKNKVNDHMNVPCIKSHASTQTIESANVFSSQSTQTDNTAITSHAIANTVATNTNNDDLGMDPANTSANVSFLQELLHDMEISPSQPDISSDNVSLAGSSTTDTSRASTSTPIQNYDIYIGKTMHNTTVGDMHFILTNMGVTDITLIKTVSRPNRYYVSFHVAIKGRHNADMIYNYNWGAGIIVEQLRGSPPGGHHQSLESESSAAGAYRHHARKRRVRASNVPPRFSGNTQLSGRSPDGIPMTPPAIPPRESFPQNVTPLQNGRSNVTTHAQDTTVHPSSHVRQTVPYPHNPLYSPITPTEIQRPTRSPSASAPPHMIHVPTAELPEIRRPARGPSASHGAAVPPWAMPLPWVHPAMIYQYAHMFNTHAANVQHQLAVASNTPVRPQHTEPTVNTSIAQPSTVRNPIPIHMSTPSRPAQ